jgi:Ca-activated chloride channel family protein
MSFAAPGFLLLLLLVPVAVVVYVLAERRRARGRAAFASPALIPSVAPRRAGWRRHVPILLYAVALATLIVALARPQTTVAVPVQRASVVLVFDHSGSMRARDVPPTRLDAVRQAAGRFLRTLPAQVRVGAVGFSNQARAIQGPTRDRDAVRRALAGIQARGRTAMGEGLDLALRMTKVPATPGKRPPPAAIVLLSDGYSDVGRDPVVVAQQARRADVPVYTVSLGTPDGTIEVPQRGGGSTIVSVPPDHAAMRAIAAAGGGQAFAVEDTERLNAVYRHLGAQVTHVRRSRQQTAAFAGGALAVLVAAGLLSLRWFGRLP